MATRWRSVYDLANRARQKTTFISEDPTDPKFIDRTKQSFVSGCDVNNIVAVHPNLDPSNFSDTEVKSILNNPDLYSEYDSELDFSTALNIVNRAKEQFDTLPAPLRRRFKEDPYEFLTYVNDESNKEEMKKFGLLKEDIPITNIPVTGPEPVIQPTQPAVTQQPSAVEPTP